MLASRPVELGVESTWGRLFAFFFVCLFFAYTNTHAFFLFFFRFSDSWHCSMVRSCAYCTYCSTDHLSRIRAVREVDRDLQDNRKIGIHCAELSGERAHSQNKKSSLQRLSCFLLLLSIYTRCLVICTGIPVMINIVYVDRVLSNGQRGTRSSQRKAVGDNRESNI